MSGVLLKILVGAVLIVGSVWWVLQGSGNILGRSGLDDFVAIVNGGLPPLIFLIGLFVVWLELDELRIEKELSGRKKK
ncbi:MAG: hypothetical protein HY361_02020 [Candidatus Aenigmarchaeota archaeon]|nr:hypothetical protein [Candidatus Aenigmarchaeota archaeon]